MRVFFAGTPDFAVPSLKFLAADQETEVVGVFSQPPRPRGRGQKTKLTAVSQTARELNLPLYQVKNINSRDNLDFIAEKEADFLVVVAFGQKISGELLNICKNGAVNLHASMLPKYRGPNPIQRAILNGDRESGLTTMLMDEGWDTGPILMQKSIPIENDDTLGKLHNKMAEEGAPLLLKTLKLFNTGKINPQKQSGQPVHAPKLKQEEIYLDWEKDAENLERKLRALNPFPVARTYYRGEEWKIWKGEVLNNIPGYQPGQFKVINEEIVVQTKNEALGILKLQRPGKKPLPSGAFLRGYPLEDGDRFGRRGEKNG